MFGGLAFGQYALGGTAPAAPPVVQTRTFGTGVWAPDYRRLIRIPAHVRGRIAVPLDLVVDAACVVRRRADVIGSIILPSPTLDGSVNVNALAQLASRVTFAFDVGLSAIGAISAVTAIARGAAYVEVTPMLAGETTLTLCDAHVRRDAKRETQIAIEDAVLLGDWRDE